MRLRLLTAVTLALLTACNGDTTPIADVTPGPDAPPLEGASCEPQSGGDEDAAMFLTDVRVAAQPGFDRIVFEFEPHEGEAAGVPFHEVGQATPPLLEDPRGTELSVDGDAFLSAVIWASGVDLSGPEFREVYTGPDSIRPSDTVLVAEVREGGDFENTMTWYVGLREEACFVVSSMADPVRILLDIET